jgi:hypothetical protein
MEMTRAAIVPLTPNFQIFLAGIFCSVAAAQVCVAQPLLAVRFLRAHRILECVEIAKPTQPKVAVPLFHGSSQPHKFPSGARSDLILI